MDNPNKAKLVSGASKTAVDISGVLKIEVSLTTIVMAQSGYHHLLFYMSANTTLSLQNHVCMIRKALSAQIEDFGPF